jgi:hypothetical protein
MAKNILIYSPYSYWTVHIIFERLIARNLIDKNSNVKIIYCDDILETCDVRKKCTRCNLARVRIDGEFQTQSEKLSSFVDQSAIAPVIESLDRLSNVELLNFNYGNLNLSDQILSSFYSYFRIGTIDLSIPEIKSEYVKFLKSAVITSCAMQTAIANFKPDTVLTFNGRFFTQKIAVSIANQNGIPAVTHDVGYLADSMLIAKNTDVLDYKKFRSDWSRHKNQPLSEVQVLETLKSIYEWTLARNRQGIIFVDPEHFVNSIEKIHETSKKFNRTILFLTSSIDEVAAIDGYDEFFESQNDWIEESIRYLEKNPEIYGIIRFHPNTISKIWGTVKDTIEYIDQLKQRRLPPNVFIVYPDVKINTYGLMQMADIGVTYGSTASAEMASMKKKVLVVRNSPFFYMDSVNKCSSKELYHSMIEQTLNDSFTLQDHVDVLRFFHLYTKSNSTPFHHIRYLDQRTSFINFRNYPVIRNSSELDYMREHMFGQASELNVPEGTSEEEAVIVSGVITPKSTIPKKVLIGSLSDREAFISKKSPEYKLYKNMLLKHGYIPEIVFLNEPEVTKNIFEINGGFNGYYSKFFRFYYKTLFKVPFISPIQKLIRFTFFRFFKLYYSHDKIVKAMARYFEPDYVVDFSSDQKLAKKVDGARYFQIKQS